MSLKSIHFLIHILLVFTSVISAKSMMSEDSLQQPNLEIFIDIDSTEYYQGQQFTYYVNIKNNLDHKITLDIGLIETHYYKISENTRCSIREKRIREINYIEIGPKSIWMYPVTVYFSYVSDEIMDEFDRKSYKKFDRSKNYWKPGLYVINVESKNTIYPALSNEIGIKIKTPPEKHQKYFDMLLELNSEFVDPAENKLNYEKFRLKKALELFSNNVFEGSIYQIEFYGYLICRLGISEQDEKLRDNLQYDMFKTNPNNSYSWLYYKRAKYNPTLLLKLNEILDSMPDSKTKQIRKLIKLHEVNRK